MRIIVCGGRNYGAYAKEREVMRAWVEGLLGHQGGPPLVAHGNAKGADRFAADHCARLGVPCAAFPADWGTHGKAAGPIRNRRMLDVVEPHRVVAFPGGRGTEGMVAMAERAGVPVIRIEASSTEAAALLALKTNPTTEETQR